MKTLARGLLVILVLYVAYLFLAPSPLDLGTYQPEAMPPAVGAEAPNTLLAHVDRLDLGHFAPEDVALDSQGRIYGGTIDGKIIRLDPAGKNPEVFADTHGRPLGLIFDRDGSLLVCDAAKGLLRVATDGTVKVLATEADGVPFRCTNDLDVAADGTVYFTDSSFKYPIEAFMADLVEHVPHGRFMAYDPKTNTVKVLVRDLYFANGVAVSPDQSFVLFVETADYRVNRYWLAGPKKGQNEVFADNLPGIPDGILGNGRGEYWVTLVTPRDGTFDWLLAHPTLRKVYLKLPGSLRAKQRDYAYVLKLNADGQVTQTLQDSSPSAFIKITNAVERDGQLYLGNIGQSSIGRAALPK
ncbi:MAG TPA: SMP-30/gluconolactonase/LRE family protein [Opitutaceae bacterium]|jgi:sugar lactone lactonase YvrE|nr:SMP-30/gluconolactonase/LRE family protein [Opitutaceae bacterium]